jgi:hypothetical protein
MHIRFIRTLMFLLVVLSMAAASLAQIGVAITIGPPPLPVYEQPLCPDDGYLWTPGYWAYDNDVSDYYWVPGTWVMAPEVGFLWTPAYWGWGGDGFVFYDGYWGPHIGFYGGINYGFGYFGTGFQGGRWDNGHFFYNRSVSNVNITNIHNVYNTTVVINNASRVSFNGGNGGISARATPEEEAAGRDRHVPPLAVQTQHAQAARANPQQRASANMGKPGVAATPRPGDFNDRGAVPTKEAGAAQPGSAQTGSAQTSAAVHPHDLPALAPAASNTGNPKLDKKYQQQQQKQITQQQQERDKLQQQQDQEHLNLDKQKASDTQKHQVEQQHQQQTQQLQQKHEQQTQQLQQKQQQPVNRAPSKG